MDKRSISLDHGCILCEACAEICPEVFAISETCNILTGADLEFFWEFVEQSAEICPVNVIKI